MELMDVAPISRNTRPVIMVEEHFVERHFAGGVWGSSESVNVVDIAEVARGTVRMRH